ncbi:MAG: tryptophan--tRNA ligase [bacterium]
MKKRILSGIKPSGSIHIGNYLGAVRNWADLASMQKDYSLIFFIADLHALTTSGSTDKMQENIFDSIITLLAAGLDPKKCSIFIQSHIPEHTEMTWLLNTITPVAELERMTQFKDKANQFKQNINMGLFDYPVLMSADILLYNTNLVPVGQDQKQHIELTRTIAKKFNNQFGKTLVVPEPLIQKTAAKIMSLSDPLKKMSKTMPQGCLYMSDSPAVIHEKIKTAVTDSGKEIEYSPKKPAIANLMTIYHSFSKLSFSEIENKYKGKGYSQFKNDLSEIIIKALKPFQEKKKKLEKNPKQIKKILEKGTEQVRPIAKETLKQVKQKMGLI